MSVRRWGILRSSHAQKLWIVRTVTSSAGSPAIWVRLYNRKLTASNLLDFSDLLLRADALLADPETAALWRDRYRYIHVDEVQDVSVKLAEHQVGTRGGLRFKPVRMPASHCARKKILRGGKELATVEGIVSGYRDGMGVALTDFTDPRTHLHQDFFAPLLQALEAGRVVVFDVESTRVMIATRE